MQNALFKVCIFIFFHIGICLHGQQKFFLSQSYNNSISEWEIYPDTLKNPEDDYLTAIGTIQVRWPFEKDNYSEWQIRFGDKTGSIRQRWNNKSNEWEMRLGESYLYLSPKWPNQMDASDDWLIQFQDKNYSLELSRENGFKIYTLSDLESTYAEIYNEFFMEFTDFICEVNQSTPEELVLSMLFLSMYYTHLTPR